MAKAEMDMIRDILGWSISTEQKLALIGQVTNATITAKPASGSGTTGEPVRAPAQAGKKKRAIRKAARPTRRSQLWNELKRLAPGKAAKLSYTKGSTEQLEPMVEKAKKGK